MSRRYLILISWLNNDLPFFCPIPSVLLSLFSPLLPIRTLPTADEARQEAKEEGKEAAEAESPYLDVYLEHISDENWDEV